MDSEPNVLWQQKGWQVHADNPDPDYGREGCHGVDYYKFCSSWAVLWINLQGELPNDEPATLLSLRFKIGTTIPAVCKCLRSIGCNSLSGIRGIESLGLRFTQLQIGTYGAAEHSASVPAIKCGSRGLFTIPEFTWRVGWVLWLSY